jgi:uncharacterized repeat protein (TIGR04052 family)
MKAYLFVGTLLLTAGCITENREVISIPFEAHYKEQSLHCGKEVAVGETQPGVLWLTDLRFFIHDIEVQSKEGNWLKAPLVADERFQTTRVALLDFEDGTGPCADGTSSTHTEIKIEIPLKSTHGLRFKLGVPFGLNHLDPAKQKPPLNVTSMHWGRREGYKFFRLDMVDSGGDGLKSHLGSTGCEGTVGNITGCKRANIASIEFSQLELRKSAVVVDVVELLSRLDGDRKPVLIQCMAAADGDHCGATFSALGLDLVSGKPRGNQLLFRSK